MNRQEQIEAAADKYTDNPANYLEYCDDGWEDKTDIGYVERAFMAGIEWADAHPDEGLVSIDKVCTLYDLLRKMPSCITVDGIDYHFVLKKAVFYRAYYEGEGEEGSGKVIFGVTAYSPIDLLAEMLEILKEKGLLE